MSHPDPNAAPDRTPIVGGEVWEDPVTRERVTILERPWDNPERRASAEMTALVGAQVVGEHYHPALVERFPRARRRADVKRNGQISVLHQGLARLGHTDSKGMPHPLQLSLIAREFGDVVVFRSPPSAVQLLLFGVPPGARWRGYHATYPQRSRILLAPRT